MSTVPVSLAVTSDMELALDLREIEGVRRILFFDGVCGLCNWSIDFVLKRDRGGKFQFAPLQGETARTLLTPVDVEDLNTLVLWVGGRTDRKSAAVVRVLWQLGPGWQILGTLLWLIPLPLRNLAYTLVARNRYQLFGKKDTCRLPTPSERVKFLP
jgi:predicted DCC family thiol-disulfide oxidoreductase YuxK